jgi:outer membrane protein insertion porin family
LRSPSSNASRAGRVHGEHAARRTFVIAFASSLLAAPARADDDEPTGIFQIGAGFSSDDGFVAAARVAQDDLFDTGQHLSLDARLAARLQDFRLRYGLPDLGGFELDAELFSTRRVFRGFTRDGLGGALTVGRRLDEHTRVFVRYGVEHVAVELADRITARRLQPGPPPGDGLLVTLGAGVEHSTLDDPDLPRRGTRLAVYGESADPALGSDHRFVRATAALDHARPLGPLTLRLRGRAAWIGGDAPLSERLFHDGHAEVRGYAYETVGDPRGETFEASGRIELEAPLWPALGLSVAGFADAGLRGAMSVGASLIWRSPIGVLRFDWAVPLAGDPQFLFGIE